jgi:tetratricopeptide (TPR) repeat protein
VAISVPHGLLEREAELRRLGTLLNRALKGRGGVAFLDGPAGIGKTRLLWAICGVAARRGIRVLSARGGDLERQFPYGVVRQLFEAVVLDRRPGSQESLLEGPAAYAAPVFSSTTLDLGDGEQPDRSAAVLHGLYWLTYNLVASGPLLLAVDDAHWADAASLLFLHYLARRVDGLPLAVVLTSRQVQPGPEADLVQRIAAETPAGVIELRPLSINATAELVRSMVGAESSDELCEACHGATGGNPFLVKELATALVEGGVAPGAEAAGRVGRLVPHSVARHVLVRLARLGPTTIRVAHAVAVLGGAAEIRHVAALAGLDEAETAGAVDALVSADILGPGLPLDFRHPLLGEAVYADARVGERLLAHARAARVLADSGSAPERVASQLVASEPAGSEWAVAALRAAAREASARGAPGSAARYLERALVEPPRAADRCDLLLELGVAESRAGLPPAADHLSEALRLTTAPVTRARIAQELAGLYNLLGRFVESASVLEGAIGELGKSEQELGFSLEAELAVLGSMDFEVRQTLAPRMEALRVKAREAVGTPAAAPLLAVIAFELAQTDGTAEVVIDYAERAFAGPMLLARDGPIVAIGTAALVFAGRPASAESILDAAILETRARGSLQAMGAALLTRAHARIRLGRILAAEADARLSLELSEHEPLDAVRPIKLAQLAEVLIERGEFAEAESLVSRGELACYDRNSKLLQQLGDAQTRLLLLQGRPREALELVDTQLRWQRAWGVRNPGWTSTRSLTALVHCAVGDTNEARALATEDLEAARSFGALPTLGVALRTVALVDAGPRIEYLHESVEVLEASEARLELARTLVELGSAIRRGAAELRPASLFGGDSSSRTTAAVRSLPIELAPSCSLPARGHAAHRRPAATRSRRANIELPEWLERVSRTARSHRGYSSARRR